MKKIFTLALLAMFGVGSMNAQEDVTSQYLTNADLMSLDGWSYGDDGYNYQDWNTNMDVPVIEFYNAWGPNAGAPIGNTKNFHFTQTVTLPAGDYRIAVNAFYREGNGNGNNSKAYIFAGEKQQYVHGLTSTEQTELVNSKSKAKVDSDMGAAAYLFSQGRFSNAFDFTVEAESAIELGFRGYIDTYCSWCILGPVKLYKYSLDDYLVDYRTKVAEAEALYNKPMNGEVLAALKAAVVEESTFSLGSQVQDAISALNNAITAANNSIAAYAKFFAAYEKLNASILAAIENGAPTACETALDEYYLGYEELTMLDADVDAKIAEMEAIVVNVVKQQTKAGSDMTALLVNPDYEQDEYGWTVVAAEGSGPSGRQGNVRPGGSATNHCYEAWNNSSFDIYQEVKDARAGVYEISVQGFYRYWRGNNAWDAYLKQNVDYVKPAGVPVYVYLNNNATNFTNVYGDPKQITDETFYSAGSTDYAVQVKDDVNYYFPDGMASAAIAFSDGMYTQAAYGLVAKDGDQLRIGVKGNSAQQGDSWVIWDNFKLTYRGFDPEVIKPVLETAIAEVEDNYIGLLMGKTEYAAFTNALVAAEEAISNNDGEAMFNALNALYDAKDPALVSKDIFLEQEVAADTLRLAEAIREVADKKMANTTRANANTLLNGIQNNLIYENDQIDQLKADVTAMIEALNNSVALYDEMNTESGVLKEMIENIKNDLPQLKVLDDASALCEKADTNYESGDLDDEDVSALIEQINKMKQRLVEYQFNYLVLKIGLPELEQAIADAKEAGVSEDIINSAQGVYDTALAAFNAGEMTSGQITEEAKKVLAAIDELEAAIEAITTGISNVMTQTAEGPAYNMGGQKVDKAKKGLYIINGKKQLKK